MAAPLALPDEWYQAVFNFLLIFFISGQALREDLLFVSDAFCDDGDVKQHYHEGDDGELDQQR